MGYIFPLMGEQTGIESQLIIQIIVQFVNTLMILMFKRVQTDYGFQQLDQVTEKTEEIFIMHYQMELLILQELHLLGQQHLQI